MSDKFERELREHLQREAQQVSRFPDPLRAKIQGAIEPRRRFGMAQQLAVAGALLVFIGLLAFGVGQLRGLKGGGPAASSSPVVSPSGQPSASASASNLGPFNCGSGSSGSGATGANLTVIRVAHHTGYDRITFTFDTGVPAYTITPQANTQFTKDASGQTVVLMGSNGLKIVFRDASGAGYSHASGQPTYTGSLDLKPGLTGIQEVSETGDFERVLSWGMGINGSACYRVFELSGPARLVIDVQTSS
jgi:hypothetical protein